MKAPVSVCVITRDDPHLDRCLASVAPWVEQVCVVDTSSVLVSPLCSDAEGRIQDFSAARNYVWKKATQPWVMWLDSDDVLQGADKLVELCKAPPGTCYLLPYEYAYDHLGRVITRQYRERLVHGKDLMTWQFPVHEVLIAKRPGSVQFRQTDDVVVKHQRQYLQKPTEPGRNLRILTKWMAEHPDDVRNRFYLGLEYANAGKDEDAIRELNAYLAKSAWDDERAQAYYHLAKLHERRREFDLGLKAAFGSLQTVDWFESYYAICRMFYFQQKWERCVHYGNIALSLPPTKTFLFINQSDRDDIHTLLTVAKNALGDVQGAYEHCQKGLAANPTEPSLLHNRERFERALSAELHSGSGQVSAGGGAGGNPAETRAQAASVQGGSGDSAERVHPDALGPTPQQLACRVQGTGDHATGQAASRGAGRDAKGARASVREAHGKLSVVFATWLGCERWDPETMKQGGLGGSETMLIHQARGLARLGHKVTVYADPPKEAEHDGVMYRSITAFPRDRVRCDVLVVSRYAQLLDAMEFPGEASLRLLWCHDVVAHGATGARLLQADRVLALSEWHKQDLVHVHNLHPDHVLVTRNGIDLDRFGIPAPPVRHPWVVNSSSPDRSWPVLLEEWPAIRDQVPGAELHLFYGFHNWKTVAGQDPQQRQLIAALEEGVRRTEGVVFHDRVSQYELARHMLQAKVWAHPTWFSETSCITAMEAKAAGLHIVTSNLAALKETAKGGVLIDGEWTSSEYRRQFREATVQALLGPPHGPWPDTARFGLPELAKEWEVMFYKLLEQKKTHPLVPYQPTEPYRLSAATEAGQPHKLEAVGSTPTSDPMVKLNVACGPNIFPFDGWTNYDIDTQDEYFRFLSSPNVPLHDMPEHQKRLAHWLRGPSRGTSSHIVKHDMTEPFTQHPDNSVDFIYCGQAIEHLNPIYEAPKFLKECHRMLKPGGVLRLTTPDLGRMMWARDVDLAQLAGDQPEWFAKAGTDSKRAYLMFGACGPKCTRSNYEGHFMCYSKHSLTEALNAAGFENPDYEPPDRPEVRDEGMSHSLCVEATK